MPTGSERTVWGMGDGSTLDTYATPFGRLGGLICWENYMPLARFYLYSQGVDVWVAPTLATGDGWVATMRHIAREGRCYVIGVNPCLRVDQIPADFPDRDRVSRTDPDDPEWVEPGNTVIVGPNGDLLAGPARHAETVLVAELDLTKVRSARRLFDPVGHYHRPDVFRLAVDTAPRPVVTTLRNGFAGSPASTCAARAYSKAVRAAAPSVAVRQRQRATSAAVLAVADGGVLSSYWAASVAASSVRPRPTYASTSRGATPKVSPSAPTPPSTSIRDSSSATTWARSPRHNAQKAAVSAVVGGEAGGSGLFGERAGAGERGLGVLVQAARR